jgi:hypothetical protein
MLVGESGLRQSLLVEVVRVRTGKFYREKKIRERTKKPRVLKFFTRFGSEQERIATI